MIRINLIPYRGARQQQQILQHVMVAAVVVGLAVVIILGMHMYTSSDLSERQGKLDSLIAQNKILNKKIGKIRNLDKLRKDVERKLKLVDQLQKGRFRSLEMLLAFSRVIPENVWLRSIKDSKGDLTLSGRGESNKAVANFMRALDREKIFTGVKLRVIQRGKIGKISVRKFTLKMKRVGVAIPTFPAKSNKGKR